MFHIQFLRVRCHRLCEAHSFLLFYYENATVLDRYASCCDDNRAVFIGVLLTIMKMRLLFIDVHLICRFVSSGLPTL